MISYQPTIDHAQKVERSIEQIRLAAAMSERYYDQPLLVCYSGGKDSDALLGLAELSGIKFDVQHSRTTADAPETMKHVKAVFDRLQSEGVRCSIHNPTYKGNPATMWSLIPQKGYPPTRIARYCCTVLKETGGKGRAIATGVRRVESSARAQRKYATNFSRTRFEAIDFDDASILFEAADSFAVHDSDFIRSCKMKGKTSFQPILDWLNDDVWQFIDEHGIEYNPLYDEGWKRIGCVGCPMAGAARADEFRRWPKYEAAYKQAFAKMLDERKRQGKPTEWQTADDVFTWWMEDA